MKLRFFKKHISESLALAAIFAAGLTLNTVWIVNLLVSRVGEIEAWLTFSEEIGAISGMFFVTGVVYLVSFLVMTLWYRNRDCSHQREPVYWFLIITIIIFSFLTIPGIFEFRIQ